MGQLHCGTRHVLFSSSFIFMHVLFFLSVFLTQETVYLHTSTVALLASLPTLSFCMTIIKDAFSAVVFLTTYFCSLSLSIFVFYLTLLLYDEQIAHNYKSTTYEHHSHSKKTPSRPSSFCFSFFSGTITWHCSSNTNPSSAKRSSNGK